MGVAIDHVRARVVLDGRGGEAVEAEVMLSNGTTATASVPTVLGGSVVALDARKAVVNINDRLASELSGLDPCDQPLLDALLAELDGTQDCRNLGANATLAVSAAVCRTGARTLGIPLFRYLWGACARTLPVPLACFIADGLGTWTRFGVCGIMVAPVGFDSYSEALYGLGTVFSRLGGILASRGLSGSVGDCGGYTPGFASPREGLEVLDAAVQAAGLRPGTGVFYALQAGSIEVGDVAVGEETNFFDPTGELFQWVCDFPVRMVVAPRINGNTGGLGKAVMLVGSASGTSDFHGSVFIDPVLFGTVSQAVYAAVHNANRGHVVLAGGMGGGTGDSLAADFAVGSGVSLFMGGGLAGAENTARYNRLLCIEEELGDAAVFAGKNDKMLARRQL